MATTGQLGTASAYLGNFQLGVASGATPPTPPAPTSVLVKLPTLVPRVPKNEINTDRMVRFTEQVGALLNTLIRGGVLTPDPSGGGGAQLAGLFFTGNGPPAATLGFCGDYYLDIPNGVLYAKT